MSNLRCLPKERFLAIAEPEELLDLFVAVVGHDYYGKYHTECCCCFSDFEDVEFSIEEVRKTLMNRMIL
jgi:hypothetical protein